MKKDVKIWFVMGILAIVGSGIVTIASAGVGIIPDYPAIKEVHHNTHDDNITEIVVNSYRFLEEERSYAQHDNSGIQAAGESRDNSISHDSDSNANVILLDVITPDESTPEQPNFMRGEDIICTDDLSKTTNPNMGYPPYDRGTQNYHSEIESRFNNSQTATWLNISSDATTISFMDVYTAYGIDTDSDGKYDYLAIDVRVDVKKPGKYGIEGSLKDHSTGDYIVWTFTDRILDVGVQDVTLKFNGYQIYRHGTSVKFDLKDLKLYDKDWNMLDYRSYAYTTSYYSYTYFDVPPADLTGSYSNYGIDTDGDGKYNYLAIDVWVNVKVGGYYSLRGWLDKDGDKFITYASTGSHLNEGLQKVTLKFNGYEIYRRGVNAQFVLGLVELQVRSDDDWNIVDQKWDAHTTSFYYYTGFDKPPADITGSYSHYGIDADGDGKYDYLAIDVWVNVKENGYYRLEGWLEDCYGYYITYDWNRTYLKEGLQKLTLEFNGYEIYRHGVSGSLGLGHVKLLDYGWNVIEEKWDVYSTSYYAYTYFDTPPIDFTGAYADYGVDTDGNGEYDYLVVEVGVNVKEAGTYSVSGNVYDNENERITYGWAEAELSPGLQKLTLKFDGYMIYRNGVDGPFNLGYVALSDKWNRADYKYDAYITSYYNYTEFDRKFTGNFDDYGVDTDEDGLYNYLVVEAEINVTKAGEYKLSGSLQPSGYTEEGYPWPEIDSDWNRTYLEAGIQSITLQFDGTQIYNTKYSGSFRVWLSLYGIEKGNWIDGMEYYTNDYDYTDYQKPAAEFAQGFTDYGLDTDGNSLYDYLVIEKEIIVRETGNYRLRGLLKSTSGETLDYDYNDTYLDVGLQSIKLQFYGPGIYTTGESGNFVVDMNLHETDDGIWLDSTTNTTSYYSYTDFERPPAEFAPGFNDYGLDTDRNSLYNYLAIEKEIIVREAGNYRLRGWLKSTSGETIDYDYNDTYLDVGLQSIKLQFYGPGIYTTGESGNFVVDMDLHETDDGIWLDSTTNTTSYYSYTDFERPPAEFAAGFNDYGLDTNGNSLYDYLVIEKEVIVREAGNYQLSGSLKSPSGEGIDYDYNYTYLDVGLQSIELQFYGPSVYKSGESGNFDVNMVLYGTYSDSTTNTTSYYSHTDFERPPAEFMSGFNDYGLDTNGNSLYDYLIIEKEIEVKEAGNYNLIGSLESPSGKCIDSDYNYTYLEVGLQSVKLQFYGPSIYNKRESGNFGVIMNLQDRDSGKGLDSTTNTTSYYSYTDFEMPSAEFTGKFTDHGLDTDEDTLYNYLVVEAEINVKKAGEYKLYCALRTPSGAGVGSYSNETQFDVGIHNITSQFSGHRTLGYNGSFKAEWVLRVVEEWAEIDDAEYLTSDYNYTDFDPVMPPVIVSLTVNPNMNINKDNPAVINTTVIGDYLRGIFLFSGEKVESNETTNIYELRSVEWIPSDEWFFVGNNTYNITAEWNATAIGSYIEEEGGYIGCYYATDDINETYPLICELPAEYNVLNRTIYYSQLGLFLYNGTWYPAVTYYFSDTEKVEVVYVSSGMVFLNTPDPKLIEEFPDAKSLDPNSKCKFMNLLIITDSNGTIIEDPFRHGEETRESKEFRIGDLMIKKNTPLPAGEYLIGMNVEDEAGNRGINGTAVFTAGIAKVFDTGPGAYPSIFGTHNGTIIPSYDINVSKLYTYSYPGTGGHTESIELYENGKLIAYGTWNGYKGDWHNITIHNVTGASYVTLLKEYEYNYVIKTGSYPQIHHTPALPTANGWISCIEFTDANGRIYYDRIPAIRLWWE